MSWQLFRLGRWSFQHRKTVLIGWVLLLAALVAGAGAFAGATKDSFELDGVESMEAFDLIEERLPESAAGGASARIVFEAPDGESILDGEHAAAVATALGELERADIVSVTDPFTTGAVSDDGRVAYASVSFAEPAIDLAEADQDRLAAVQESAEDAGLRAVIGGDALPVEAHPPIGELIGIAVALVVLAITFGSLVAAGMPVLTALIGVAFGISGLTLATGFVELSSATPVLGLMLGLAVGIDYALFIMSRYQHEVRQGRPLDEAAGRAVGTAGTAVVFAGLTVIIALCALAVCGVSFLTQMGIGGAVMVAVAVLVALTLLPALLGLLGRRAFAVRLPFNQQRAERSNGQRWIETVARFKWPALLGGVAVAAVVSIPVASMQLAMPDDGIKPADSDGRIAYDLLAESFGEGFNGPLVIVVDTEGSSDAPAAVRQVGDRLQRMQADGDRIASLTAPVSDDPAIQAVLDQQLEQTGLATFQVVPTGGPSDRSTTELVADLREQLADLPDDAGARALVSGQTALGIDIADELISVFPLYLAVVVGLALVLLVMVFRSLLVPIKAALGFLLSVGVSLGATVAVFQWGWFGEVIGLDATSPVLFLLPTLLTGILFGLAMDYEVFLVTRMREAYVHGRPARQAVVEGFAHSARVVTAAAVIMIAVFAGFALSDDAIAKSIGFALAVGILADAFLVRMLIMPAVMLIVGDRIWWLPRWLDRILPNLDIEGEGLTRRLDAAAPVVPEPVTAH